MSVLVVQVYFKLQKKKAEVNLESWETIMLKRFAKTVKDF